MASQELFSIKAYEPADAQATIEIFLRAVREVASKDYNPAQIAAWAKVDDIDVWAQWRASRPTWLVMNGSVAIGFADLKADGCLDMMFVHMG
jgi:putative acetyltransferase